MLERRSRLSNFSGDHGGSTDTRKQREGSGRYHRYLQGKELTWNGGKLYSHINKLNFTAVIQICSYSYKCGDR